MVFQDFLDFLVFLETSEVAGPGPNPREIDISFGAQWPLACARPDPTIGWTDVLPCVFVCVWGRYPPAAALLVRRLVVPVLNKLLQLPLHTYKLVLILTRHTLARAGLANRPY